MKHLQEPSALGCTTFKYNNPNDNTDDYPGGYSKNISPNSLTSLFWSVFMISSSIGSHTSSLGGKHNYHYDHDTRTSNHLQRNDGRSTEPADEQADHKNPRGLKSSKIRGLTN